MNINYKRLFVQIIFCISLLIVAISYTQLAPGKVFWLSVLLYSLIPLITCNPKYFHYIAGGSILVALLFIVAGKGTSFGHWAAGLSIIGTIVAWYQHHSIIDTKQKVSSWTMAHAHAMVFSIVYAIIISLALMGKGNKLNITCDEVRNTMNTHLNTLLAPLKMTATQISHVEGAIDTFFNKTPGDIVKAQIENNINSDILSGQDFQSLLNTQVKGMNTSGISLNNILKATAALGYTGSHINMSGAISSLQSSSSGTTTNTTSTSSGGLLNYYKNLLLDTPLMGKQDIDKKMCTVVFEQIQKRYEQPGFRISILVTFILFFYPLLQFLVAIYSGILAIIYEILIKAGFIDIVDEPTIKKVWHL